MNNQNLLQALNEIAIIENPLDRFVALKQFNKKYKKSHFYKQTKLNVFKAFELITKISSIELINKINILLSEENLSNFINQQLSNIHFDDVLNRLLYSVDYEHVNRMLQNVLPDNNLDAKQLKTLIEQLKGVVKELPH